MTGNTFRKNQLIATIVANLQGRNPLPLFKGENLMDEIRRVCIYENSAYLATVRGNVYRVWIDGETPSIEELLPKNALEVLVWMDQKYFISKSI